MDPSKYLFVSITYMHYTLDVSGLIPVPHKISSVADFYDAHFSLVRTKSSVTTSGSINRSNKDLIDFGCDVRMRGSW